MWLTGWLRRVQLVRWFVGGLALNYYAHWLPGYGNEPVRWVRLEGAAENEVEEGSRPSVRHVTI